MYVQIKPLLNRILSIERVKYKEDHLPFVLETAATHAASTCSVYARVQYIDQEMIPARNARNVVTLAEVMFVTIQRENILPS
jgi:hypothetical protein